MLVYTASFDAPGATSAATTLLELTAGASCVAVIIEASITQTTDYGDAEAEGIRILMRRYSSNGTGGTGLVENPHMTNYPAAGSAVVRNASGGTATANLPAEGANIQAGYFYKPVPEARIYVPAGGIIGWELMAAPTDAITFSGYVTWGEIGA